MSDGRGGARKGAGRKKGGTNAVNKLIKDAVIEAAEIVGADGEGKDGLVGYLQKRAEDQPQAFMGMLSRIIPTQVEGTGDDGEIKISVTQKIVKA
tara:strand:+ start:1743 stop:2027 length:285 start_codon:yes stop_codon:yes gene_type:complete